MEPVRLDKHRESLTKYCYDVSKIVLAVAVINPVAAKSGTFLDLSVGLLVAGLFLVLAVLFERGGAP